MEKVLELIMDMIPNGSTREEIKVAVMRIYPNLSEGLLETALDNVFGTR